MNYARSMLKRVTGSNANDQNGIPVDQAVDALEPVEAMHRSVDKKKGWFAKSQTSSTITESQEEFYARMQREEEERETERRRKKLEDQRKRDEERRQREERRLLEDEARRREESAREAEREREALRAKEDLERQLRLQREEHERMLSAQRQKAQTEIERAREEREYQEQALGKADLKIIHIMQMEIERHQREQMARDEEMERKNDALRLQEMEWLERNNRDATAALNSAVTRAASDSASASGKILEELTTETETSRQLRIRTAQLQKELDAATILEHDKTEQFIQGVDESMKAAIQELERKKERDLEEKNRREKETDEGRSQYEAEWKAKTEREEKEQQEKHKQYLESQERIRREKEADSARHDKDLDRMRDAHATRVEELLAEERARMDEINRMRIEKEEERRVQWNRMRNAFVEMMRTRYAGMMSNEMEKKWDDRFTELRRAYNPVQEAFTDLESIPLFLVNLAKSLIPFECYLDSLRMALSTLEDVMASEREQVAEWREQQPDAHFLSDLEYALDTILTAIGRVRREINMVVDDVAMNRESASEIERVFELRYLGERMKLLSEAVHGIPTVYDLNKKYANGTYRTETTL